MKKHQKGSDEKEQELKDGREVMAEGHWVETVSSGKRGNRKDNVYVRCLHLEFNLLHNIHQWNYCWLLTPDKRGLLPSWIATLQPIQPFLFSVAEQNEKMAMYSLSACQRASKLIRGLHPGYDFFSKQ